MKCIHGITFYMWGFVFFTCAMGAFFYKKAPNLYGYLIIGALIADMAFLTYQLLLWPCLNCLLVAAIIGALGITVEFTDSVKKKAQMWLRGALLLWGLVFFSVSINAAKEIVLQPWALLSPANEIAIVYFSPTCPSCEQTVMNLLNSPDAARVRLIPVAKNDTDARRLAALPEHPTVANIKNMFRSDASTAEMTLIDRLNMMRNKASMASKGISQVPTIISNTIVASQSTFSFILMMCCKNVSVSLSAIAYMSFRFLSCRSMKSFK